MRDYNFSAESRRKLSWVVKGKAMLMITEDTSIQIKEESQEGLVLIKCYLGVRGLNSHTSLLSLAMPVCVNFSGS